MLISSHDNIETFIPGKKPQLVILGTMAAIQARDIESFEKNTEAFFYHNKRNHFWRILQLVFEPKKGHVQNMNLEMKKSFLNKWNIAMANIIQTIEIPEELSENPSDDVIFKAYQQKRVVFKKVDSLLKQTLEKAPLFFTCSRSNNIVELLRGYFKKNSINRSPEKGVEFLMTPTRCNPVERSLGWKIRMAQCGVFTESVCVPEDYIH